MPPSGLGKGQKVKGEEIKFIAVNLTAPPELEEASFLWHGNKASPTAPWSVSSVVSQEQRCLSTVSAPPPAAHVPTTPPTEVGSNLTQSQTLNGESCHWNLTCNLYRTLMRRCGKSQLRILNMGTNEVCWYEPHFTFCFLLQPPSQEQFGSMSISGHCQIILKKRMPRTKKPNREKNKSKNKNLWQSQASKYSFSTFLNAANSKICFSDSIHSVLKEKDHTRVSNAGWSDA